MKAIQTLPELRVELDGVPLSTADQRALCSVLVRQRLSLPALCELRFFDPDGSLSSATALSVGASLRVGVPDGPAPLFAGQVTAAEYVYHADGERELRLRGYDLLHRLRKRQPVRGHTQVSLADLAGELVADLGVTIEAAERGPVQATLLQLSQSDFELLADSAERCGLYFSLREDVLHILTLEGVGSPVPLKLGASLFEARFEVNGDLSCRMASAAGWDPCRAELHQGRATRARVGRTASAEVAPGSVGALGECTLVGQIAANDDSAAASAQAELDDRIAREVTLTGVAEGNPLLRPGAIVDVQGVAAHLAGCYVLATVTHTCDARRGLVSEIDTAPPPDRPHQSGADLALGIVTRTDDPEGLGRVRASLPAANDVETDWLEVVAAGAGAGKGIMLLPEVEDRVLLLFSREDPARGVVIGGLYGIGGPPDAGLEGGSVSRYTLLTRGGQRVRLDDGLQTIRVENSDGSYCELAPQKVCLHAQTDLDIEAPGHRVVIRAAAIDLERG